MHSFFIAAKPMELPASLGAFFETLSTAYSHQDSYVMQIPIFMLGNKDLC
jgi:hypothetical protein